MRWVRTAPISLCESILLTIASIDPESEDNFTDAQSQTRSRSHSRPESPIPITRVERVDHDAAYGEVPGTDAYEMRTEDARPDEIAFIPEDEDKLNSAPPSGAVSPGGHQIPKTVVEEVPASPVINSLSRRGTLSSHKRNPSDAMPDLVLQVEDTGDASPVKSPHSETLSVPDYNSGTHEKNDDTPGMSQYSHFPTPIDQVKSGSRTNRATSYPSLDGPSDDAEPDSQADADNAKDTQNDEADEAEDDGFGDFDDFEQGDEDAEFGDFDEADFQEAESAPELAAAPVQSLPQIAAPLFVSDSRAVIFSLSISSTSSHLLLPQSSHHFSCSGYVPLCSCFAQPPYPSVHVPHTNTCLPRTPRHHTLANALPSQSWTSQISIKSLSQPQPNPILTPYSRQMR